MLWPRKKFRVLKSKKRTSKHLACFSSLDSVMASAMIAIYLMEKLIDKPTSMTAKFLHKNKLYQLMMIWWYVVLSKLWRYDSSLSSPCKSLGVTAMDQLGQAFATYFYQGNCTTVQNHGSFVKKDQWQCCNFVFLLKKKFYSCFASESSGDDDKPSLSSHSNSRQTPACSYCRLRTRWRSWTDRWSSGRPS